MSDPHGTKARRPRKPNVKMPRPDTTDYAKFYRDQNNAIENFLGEIKASVGQSRKDGLITMGIVAGTLMAGRVIGANRNSGR